MKSPVLHRTVELLLCLIISFAFIALAMWLAVAPAGRWHIAHCFQPDAGFLCAASAVYLDYWWLIVLAAVPLFGLGLFLALGRRGRG